MSVLEKITDGVKAITGDPEGAYRKMVIQAAGDENDDADEAVLDAADRLTTDFDADLRRLRRRREADRVLREDVPRLEQECQQLEVVASAVNFGNKLIVDYLTIRELHEALRHFDETQRLGYVSSEKAAAADARADLQRVKTSTTGTLAETACPTISAEATEVRNKIDKLRRAIGQRQTPQKIEGAIARQTELAGQPGRGERPSIYTAAGDSAKSRSCLIKPRTRSRC